MYFLSICVHLSCVPSDFDFYSGKRFHPAVHILLVYASILAFFFNESQLFFLVPIPIQKLEITLLNMPFTNFASLPISEF